MKQLLKYLKERKNFVVLLIITYILVNLSIKIEINYRFENIIDFLTNVKNYIICLSVLFLLYFFFSLKRIIFLKLVSIKTIFIISLYLFGIYGLWEEWLIFNLLFISCYWITYFWITYFIFRDSKDLFINSSKNCVNEIYPSRIPIKMSFLEIIKSKENQKSLILIDGIWGVGKSFFVNKSLTEFENTYTIINIDTNIFNDKKHLIDYLLTELNNILIDNGVRTKSLKKYADILNETVDNKVISSIYSLVTHNDTIEEIQENINDDIKLLDKKIFIVIDNLERILDDKKIIDILGFIHHLYEKFDLTILVLAHSSKLIRQGIEKEYLGKFFINDFYLTPINYSEIIERFTFRRKEIVEREFFLNVFRNFELICGEIKKRLFWDEKDFRKNLLQEEFDRWNLINEFILNRLIQANERINLPRNLERIYHTHNTILDTYKNFYKDKNFNEIFNQISLFLSIYKITFEESYIINIQSKDAIKKIEEKVYLRKDGSKDLEKITEENLALFHLYFSKVIEKLNLSEECEKLAEKTIFRFITNNMDEENIFNNIMSFLEEKIYSDSFNEVINDFIYFASYIDKEEKAYDIYYKIMKNIEENKIKKVGNINFKIFEDETLLKLDYKYSLISKKSIFDNFETIGSNFKNSHFNLILSYIDTFEKIGRYLLGYKEELRDYTEDIAFILKFKKDICKKMGFQIRNIVIVFMNLL